MTTKTEAVGIRLEARFKAQLQAIAESEHRSLSNLVTMVLRQYCESQTQTPSTAKAKKIVNGHDHKAAKTASP